MPRKLISISSFLILLSIFVIADFSQTNSATAATVSTNGQAGFSELSRCLNSNDVLDVYYMIDESSSLSSGSNPGEPGSDPNDDRARILAASVESLQNLRPGLTVNVGVATFARDAREQRPWVQLTNESTRELASWIREEVPDLDQGGATNWKAALEFSQNQLAKSPSKSGDRCQALVWFTDGYLNVANDPYIDSLSNRQAMGELCSTDHIRGETFTSADSSIVAQMRSSGVTILGIQLQDKNWTQVDLDYASLMRSIVEGEGSTGVYAGYKCGVVPIPTTSRPGALLIAENPFDLAFQFQSIGQQASGGVSIPLTGNPAIFKIEPGVESFTVATTDQNWKLTSPTGLEITSANASDAGFEISEDAGSLKISHGLNVEDLGDWQLYIANPENDRAVYLFSGLGISIYNTDFFDGEKGSISGSVVRKLDGKPVDLSVYSEATTMTLSLVDANGVLLAPIPFPIESNGSFSLDEIQYPGDRSDVDLRLQLDLSTKSGIKLAPISFAKKVPIALRKDFPIVQFDSPLTMTNLVGKKPAQASMTLIGPESGSGQVCFDTPNVRDTEINRSWDIQNTLWTVSGSAVTNSGTSCVDLYQGETKSIEVSLANSEVAESQVSGEIPITLISQDVELVPRKVKVPFVFTSTRAGESGTVLLLEVLLTVLGILIPLILLYLVTFWTTKFSAGNDLIRKQIPVTISPSGVKINEGSENVKFAPLAPMEDTRDFKDISGLVNLRARVSKLVFPAPWFEAQATDGSRLISFVAAPRSKAHQFESGKTVAIGPDLGKHNYFVLNESELKSANPSDAVTATLIIYSRLGRDETSRLNEILMSPGTWERVSALKARIAEEGSNKTSSSKTKNFVGKSNKADEPKEFPQSSPQAGIGSAPIPNVPPVPLGGSVPPPPGLGSAVPQPGTSPGSGNQKSTPSSLPGLGGSVPPPPI